MTPGPRVFRLNRTSAAPDAPPIVISEEPLDAIAAADGVPVLPARRRKLPWGAVLLSALGGLATLAIGLGVERLIGDLFSAAPWLGWIGLVLAALAGLAFLAIVSRELRGVWRERRLERLRGAAAAALATRDGDGAKRVVADLSELYRARIGETVGRELLSIEDEIMEPEDRLAFAERVLVAPRDGEAKRAIATAAKQVSVVTAISPRAIVDVAFVLYAAARLLRRIAQIYGGRPGLIGGLRLARAALNHLTVTGGVAIGDSIVQQVLGLGLAARVSAKLGEGVLNGLMTARFGLAALEVCRPMPFIGEEPPRLGEVASELLSRREDEPPA